MEKYFDKEGNKNDALFDKKLKAIHDEIEFGDISDLARLLQVRNKLYRLKRKYEECGTRFLDCEAEILALNGIIEETRHSEQSM